jgi:hypothetical protein
MPNSYLSQDFAFLRILLKAQVQIMVLRWRKGDQAPFRKAEEIARMEEDLLQHCSGMISILSLLMLKAQAEESIEFDQINLHSVMIKIQFHDCEEILTSDIRNKTSVHKLCAKGAWKTILNHTNSLNFSESLRKVQAEYESKEKPEDRLVKALDEVQACIYLVATRKVSESTRDWQHIENSIGYTCAKEFPTLCRVMDILIRLMRCPSYVKKPIEELRIVE